jgi:hypothetical protein
MERYLSSSPEDDPQPAEIVASAAANLEASSIGGGDTHNRTQGSPKRRKITKSEDGTHSDIASRSEISTGQESSPCSENSGSSHTSGKQGKRRTHSARPLSSKNGRYYCTVCWKNFPSGAAWRKHETTVHTPQHEFECRMAELKPTISNCGGCVDTGLGCQRSLDHNYKACKDRTKEARTFNRKDHFMNHMSGIHNAGITPTIAGWRRSNVHNTKSRCGFCGKWFPTWSERLDHIGEHYRHHVDFDRSKWKDTGDEEESVDAARPQPKASKDQLELSLVLRQQQGTVNSEITSFLRSYLSRKKPYSFLDHVLKDEVFADWEARGLKDLRLLKHTSSVTHEDGKTVIRPQGNVSHHKDCSAKIGGPCKFDQLKRSNIVPYMVM